MWFRLGKAVLKYRILLLSLLLGITIFMGYHAAKIELSYELNRAIPTDNPKYQAYLDFKNRFGDDGNMMVLGIQTGSFYRLPVFQQVIQLTKAIKTVKGVENVLGAADAVMLVKNDTSGKLGVVNVFPAEITTQAALDSSRAVFENLPFYKGMLYNPTSKAYVLGLTLNKDSVNSKARTALVNQIQDKIAAFEKATGLDVHVSGLPFIRTTVANRISKEMQWLLLGSLLLSAITLMLFFRSVSATVMSLLVVIMGVIWSLGTMVLFGYKITLLNALIPPLVVVIGIPNCIYFLNKYHLVYKESGDKNQALINMVGKMGIVTLFCNIAAAIGFAVFALTKSVLLKEFGVVAGINIMALFFISLVFIPPVLSFLPPPKPRHIRYLDNKLLVKLLEYVERWTVNNKKVVYGVTILACLVALTGTFKLKTEGFIVDDLPKTDKIYTDLKWFEQHFNGIMPLEIVVDTKKKNGVVAADMEALLDIDELSAFITTMPQTARPLSLAEGLKFANQAFYDNDSLSYMLPMQVPATLSNALKAKPSGGKQGLAGVMSNFIDSTGRYARISVNMKDVGTEVLPKLIDSLQQKANAIFDAKDASVQFTGASVTFLEGSKFIINGLKESVFWAFLLIAICMLYLFRSFPILICSLIPNIIPLFITAGVMGWAGVPIKPSTVLVFSVALGIAIDVTIRFLINYKQELPHYNYNIAQTLIQTIRHTGISIIYTSLVLIAGFIIFCLSSFGGTKALGWLTSLTLVVGTITNLVLLPVLISHLSRRKK
jgi:predicted RND superfamily exporter protein